MRVIFWASIALVAYAYAIYPVIIWALAALRDRRTRKEPIEPSVSVVLACHNEERRIRARIENLLACDYPKDKLEVIVVSDGSTDRTAELARVASERVRVFSYEERRGKAFALNLGVGRARGQIIVFADARQRFEPSAIRQLVANFADPEVGAVSGELILRQGGSPLGDGIGLYWRYEKWIRKNEGRFDSVIGATGAIYAIRRELWRELPENTILDDVYTPMQIALAGWRVVFEPRAIAYDVAEPEREFSRKVRTLAGNYQLCLLMPQLLMPNRLSFQFWSHKLARLIAPLLLLIALAANMAIVAARPEPLYQLSLIAQALFYGSVALGRATGGRPRLAGLAYSFSMMQLAALVGMLHFISGRRDVWKR